MNQILGHYRKVYGSSESLEIFYNDCIGSCVSVISSSDTKLDTFTYSTWGVPGHPYGPSSDNYLASFTGKSYDDTGLIYFNARYYDPVVKRFLSEDPARQGLSWFNYVGNNPINTIDIDGKLFFLPFIAAVASIGMQIARGESAESIMKNAMFNFVSLVITAGVTAIATAATGGTVAVGKGLGLVTGNAAGETVGQTIGSAISSMAISGMSGANPESIVLSGGLSFVRGGVGLGGKEATKDIENIGIGSHVATTAFDAIVNSTIYEQSPESVMKSAVESTMLFGFNATALIWQRKQDRKRQESNWGKYGPGY